MVVNGIKFYIYKGICLILMCLYVICVLGCVLGVMIIVSYNF